MEFFLSVQCFIDDTIHSATIRDEMSSMWWVWVTVFVVNNCSVLSMLDFLTENSAGVLFCYQSIYLKNAINQLVKLEIYKKNVKFESLLRKDLNTTVHESLACGESQKHIVGPFRLIMRCHMPCKKISVGLQILNLKSFNQTYRHFEPKPRLNCPHVWHSQPLHRPPSKCTV